MSSHRSCTQGLDHGKKWDALPAEEGPINWSFNVAQGIVQGPLDLNSFQGQSMMLSLDTGQIALLTQDNNLCALYLDGIHNLKVGHGFNQISPNATLVFINTAASLQLRWKKNNPIQWNDRSENSLIGHCDLAISDPIMFFEGYLQRADSIAEERALTEIDVTVRSILADMIGTGPLGGGPTTAAELESRLTCLSSQTLTEELADQGLSCHQLALYPKVSQIELDSTARDRFAPVHY